MSYEDEVYSVIGDEIKGTLELYKTHRIETGGFLRAVLENDLMEACKRADLRNQKILFNIVSYCYNELPSGCWGNREKVETWLKGPEEESQ